MWNYDLARVKGSTSRPAYSILAWCACCFLCKNMADEKLKISQSHHVVYAQGTNGWSLNADAVIELLCSYWTHWTNEKVFTTWLMLNIYIKKILSYLWPFPPQLHVVNAHQWTSVWSLNYCRVYWTFGLYWTNEKVHLYMLSHIGADQRHEGSSEKS